LRGAADESVRGYGEEIAGYLLALLLEEPAADEVFSRVCEKPRPSHVPAAVVAAHLALPAGLERRARLPERAERTPIGALRTTEISGIGAEIAASRPPFERSSFVDAFAKLRESLDPQEQTLLTLRLHAGMSWNEIAEVVGRKPAALRKRYERLKARCGSKPRPPAFSAGRAGLNALSRNMNSSRFPTRASLRFDRPACASWRSRLLRDAKRCHAQKMWTDARLTRSKRSKTTTPNNAKTCVKSGP